MKKASIKQFLKPSWKKLLVLVIFMFIAFAGYIQSWGISGDEVELPKPLLYDVLTPFPFWILLMYLLVPVFIGDQIVRALVDGVFDWIPYGILTWFFLFIILVYFYLLACGIIFIVKKLSKKR